MHSRTAQIRNIGTRCHEPARSINHARKALPAVPRKKPGIAGIGLGMFLNRTLTTKRNYLLRLGST
jgi:hypothetical protein